MRIEKHRNTSSLTTNISAAVPESFLQIQCNVFFGNQVQLS